jgi:biopolymer transport protein ExbD
MARQRRSGTGEVSINMTPMIDCTFQLIIFFILATRFTSQAIEPLMLARPSESQAQDSREMMDSPNRVIVNVVSKEEPAEEGRYDPVRAGEARAYVIYGTQVGVGDERRLIELFKQKRTASREMGMDEKDFFVEIRADKRVKFASISTVMTAAAKADIPRMNITARMSN